MKQGLNPRRSRGRGNPRGRHPNSGGNRNHQLDSNGPEGRIRGSATQILERYLALARDAQSAGDTVAAENLFQHAEHYFRVINVNGGSSGQQNRPRSPDSEDGRDGDDESDFEDAQGRFAGAPPEGWRQPRSRDDRHTGRGEDRFRQDAAEQHRQRDEAPSPARAEAQEASPRPAGGGDRERQTPDEPRRGGAKTIDDPGEHRPAFLRRREPPREPVSGGSPTASEGRNSPESVTPGETGAPATDPAALEGSAASTPAEKPKPRARRRRTTPEGEEVVRTPRRRSSAKRQPDEAEEERPETVEGRDLETSV